MRRCPLLAPFLVPLGMVLTALLPLVLVVLVAAPLLLPLTAASEQSPARSI
jgi:hypothetical protein